MGDAVVRRWPTKVPAPKARRKGDAGKVTAVPAILALELAR
jgi:hypothetical protein